MQSYTLLYPSKWHTHHPVINSPSYTHHPTRHNFQSYTFPYPCQLHTLTHHPVIHSSSHAHHPTIPTTQSCTVPYLPNHTHAHTTQLYIHIQLYIWLCIPSSHAYQPVIHPSLPYPTTHTYTWSSYTFTQSYTLHNHKYHPVIHPSLSFPTKHTPPSYTFTQSHTSPNHA